MLDASACHARYRYAVIAPPDAVYAIAHACRLLCQPQAAGYALWRLLRNHAY